MWTTAEPQTIKVNVHFWQVRKIQLSRSQAVSKIRKHNFNKRIQDGLKLNMCFAQSTLHCRKQNQWASWIQRKQETTNYYPINKLISGIMTPSLLASIEMHHRWIWPFGSFNFDWGFIQIISQYFHVTWCLFMVLWYKSHSLSCRFGSIACRCTSIRSSVVMRQL